MKHRRIGFYPPGVRQVRRPYDIGPQKERQNAQNADAFPDIRPPPNLDGGI
jgi:hypothetical protein